MDRSGTKSRLRDRTAAVVGCFVTTVDRSTSRAWQGREVVHAVVMPLLLVIRYPEEGEGLMAWGRRAADALGVPMEVLCCREEKGGIEWPEDDASKPPYIGEFGEEGRWGWVTMDGALESLCEYVPQGKVSFLLIGKHNSGRGLNDSPPRKLSRAVFDRVSCAVGVLRLPEEPRKWAGRVLVPCAGGRNSRVALRLGEKLGGTGATAFRATVGAG